MQYRELQDGNIKLQGEYEHSKAVSAMRQAEVQELEVSVIDMQNITVPSPWGCALTHVATCVGNTPGPDR